MKKHFLCFLLAVLLLISLLSRHPQLRPVMNLSRMPKQVLVIDAGHGGEDGGAVSLSGISESTINLSIALKTDQLCGLFGVRTLLIRSEDTSIADEAAKTIRAKKRSDLMNRVDLVNGTPNAVLLSIHQNYYPSTRSKGAQVFFRRDRESQEWAAQMQELLRLSLDSSNSRNATQIPDSVYLMNHVNCRALLVECGFLSNPEEEALLNTNAYQTKLAAVLTASYLTCQIPQPQALPQGAI